jgi:hypothetical protein
MKDPAETCEGEVLACGPAGSIIIFHGSTWHGHTANTFQRIGDLAKHLLDLRPLLMQVP